MRWAQLWLAFPSADTADLEVNAWDISGIPHNELGGRLGVCLALLMITVVLGMLASATVGFGGCLAVVISGIALFAAEISLQLGIDGQIAQGNLYSVAPEPLLGQQGSNPAHLGSGYPLVHTVTIALIIWAFVAMVAVRRIKDRG